MNGKRNIPFELLWEEKMIGAVGITDECHIIGIAGHCGDDCRLYKEGICPEQDECDEHSVEIAANQ